MQEEQWLSREALEITWNSSNMGNTLPTYAMAVDPGVSLYCDGWGKDLSGIWEWDKL